MKKCKVRSMLVVLILLILGSLIKMLVDGEFNKVVICGVALVLLLVVRIILLKWKVKIASYLEILTYIFIFCSSILGEVYDFYTFISWWDILVHGLSGFLVTMICFSFFKFFYKECIASKSKFFTVIIISFCFSITVGVMWEFLEYASDKFFDFDGQKDTIINQLSSTKLDGSKNSKPVVIKNIAKTVIYEDNDKILTTINGGYLDIGLNDTMGDLLMATSGSFIAGLIIYIVYKRTQ